MRARAVAAGADGSEALALAARELGSGGVVALPTDTVYGLAADPRLPGTTGRIFALKRRPPSVGLPLLVGGPEQVGQVAGPLPPVARRLMERFWPGALTLVLPRGETFTAALGGDGSTVGLRCPDHGLVRTLCRRLGPLAVTSANRHGEPELTTAREVLVTFAEELNLVVDGGTCTGAPSTVADCTGATLRCLREGAIPWDVVMAAAG